MLIRFARNLAERFNFRWRTVFIIEFIGLLTYSMCFYMVAVLTYAARNTFSASPTFSDLFSDIYYNGVNWPVMNVIHLLMVCMIFILAYKHHTRLKVDSRNFTYSKSGIYGTAQYLQTDDAKDIVTISALEDANGIILGKLDPKTTQNVIAYRPDAGGNHNVMVFGASGTGKTVSIVEPAILQCIKARKSFVATDLKSELFLNNYMYLRNSGYKVWKFDLNDLDRSDSWNVIGTITGSLSEIQSRTDDVVDIISRNSDIDRSTFKAPARMLLKALILRVVLGADFPAVQKNLASVNQIISDSSISLDQWFDVMKHPETAAACKIFRNVSEGSENAWKNIKLTVISTLSIFDTPAVAAATSYNNIRIPDIGEQPTALFVIPNQTYTFLSSLIFTFLFKDLIRHADKNIRPGVSENSLNVPVDFILDEFAQLGYIPEFSENLAQIRSRGISCMIILQDKGQLEPTYGLLSNSILGNCSTHINIGTNDEETAKYVSQRAGTTTVQVQTVQHQKWEGLFTFLHRRSTGEGKRELLTVDEVYRFPKDQAIIAFQAKNVLTVYKCYYWEYPIYKAGKLIRPTAADTIPPLMTVDENGDAVYNLEEREAYYAEMELNIAAYRDAHPNGEMEKQEEVSELRGFLNTVKDAYLCAKEDSNQKHKRKKKNKTENASTEGTATCTAGCKNDEQDSVASDAEEPIILMSAEDSESQTEFDEIFTDGEIVGEFIYPNSERIILDADYVTVEDEDDGAGTPVHEEISGEQEESKLEADAEPPAVTEGDPDRTDGTQAGTNPVPAVFIRSQEKKNGSSAVQKTGKNQKGRTHKTGDHVAENREATSDSVEHPVQRPAASENHGTESPRLTRVKAAEQDSQAGKKPEAAGKDQNSAKNKKRPVRTLQSMDDAFF